MEFFASKATKGRARGSQKNLSAFGLMESEAVSIAFWISSW